jgi:hypothetical protein
MLRLVVCTALTVISVAHAQPPAGISHGWAITVADDGRLDLAAFGEGEGKAAKLSGGCPSAVFPPSSDRVSLCSAGWSASAAGPSPGHSERYGNYTETIVAYIPPATFRIGSSGAPAPTIRLSLRSFRGALSRVLHAQLLIDAGGLTTNFLSPLADAAWSLGTGAGGGRIMNVPFDNNIESAYASVTAGPLAYGSSSFVTALYDEGSRHGLVVGFLEHETWKTGVEYRGEALPHRLNKITAVAGLNGKLVTRDLSPHGMVQGTRTSPLLSISAHRDWRTGMEEYAGMMADNGGTPAPLPAGVDSSPLAGWNSWGMTVSGQGEVTVAGIEAASTLLAELRDGPAKLGSQAYLDRDAIYGGLNDTSTVEWGKFVKSKGQGSGTSASPASSQSAPPSASSPSSASPSASTSASPFASIRDLHGPLCLLQQDRPCPP